MKRTLFVLAIMMSLVSFTACKKKPVEETTVETTTTTVPAPAPAPAAAPAEAPAPSTTTTTTTTTPPAAPAHEEAPKH